MKKIICQFLVFLLVLGISAETVPAKIMAAKNNTVLSETSTKQEIDDLRQIYKELFPAEYHYIEEYEKNGVSDKIQQENLKIIFDEVRKHGNKEYTLAYCFRFKKHEDAAGNAYVGYYNVSMNMDGSGLLYDLGVIVGHDTSQGFCRLSSGLDSFIRKG